MSIAERAEPYNLTGRYRSQAAEAVVRFFMTDNAPEISKRFDLPESTEEHDLFMLELGLIPATGIAPNEAVGLPEAQLNMYDNLEVYKTTTGVLRNENSRYIIRQALDITEETGSPSATVNFWARK